MNKEEIKYMTDEEMIMYLEHTSRDDFNLEEWQTTNRLNAMRTIVKRYYDKKQTLLDIKEYIEKKYKYDFDPEIIEIQGRNTKIEGLLDIVNKAIDSNYMTQEEVDKQKQEADELGMSMFDTF